MAIGLGCLKELQVPVLVSVSELAARPADHMLVLQSHLILNSLMNGHGQHAGLDAQALLLLRFKDHEALLLRLTRCVRERQPDREKERQKDRGRGRQI